MVGDLVWAGVLLGLTLYAARAEAQELPELPPIDLDAPLAPYVDEPQSPSPRPAGTDDDDGALRYTSTVTGLEPLGLHERYKALSTLERGDDIDNLAELNRRGRDDAALIERLLRAKGYYDGRVRLDVERGEGEGRASVRLTVEAGDRYTLASVEVAVSTGASETLIREILALKKGGPLDADDIEAAQARLRTRLPELGYPFALVDQPDIVIDRATRTGTYRLAIAPGSQAVVRQVRIEGARRFGDEQIARIARIAPGDRYDARDVEDLRRALVATGLFGGVNVRAVPADRRADGMQQVDIVATTEAAPLRTLAGQAGYSTGEGIRVEASWQHRNLVQPQGAVTVRGVAGTREQRLAGELRFNNFRDRDRSLSLLAEASNENQDAYEAESLTLAARLERETNLIWQKTWFWSVGSELVATSERDTDLASGITRDRTFAIAAFPASLSYDGTESLLDPTDGFRLSGRLSPELSLQNGAFAYLRAQVDGSVYQPITETIVAAARGRLGSIFGAERDRIAPSRRFYAGGGGSVRGFGYQDIGPRDQFGDPIGGRSLAEMAAELRFRVFGEFGLVAFVDAGQLYTSSMPRFSDFRFGAGFGVRYYSSFGPIRVDVATPLEPRPGDNDVGVYVSIGQAF